MWTHQSCSYCGNNRWHKHKLITTHIAMTTVTNSQQPTLWQLDSSSQASMMNIKWFILTGSLTPCTSWHNRLANPYNGHDVWGVTELPWQLHTLIAVSTTVEYLHIVHTRNALREAGLKTEFVWLPLKTVFHSWNSQLQENCKIHECLLQWNFLVYVLVHIHIFVRVVQF